MQADALSVQQECSGFKGGSSSDESHDAGIPQVSHLSAFGEAVYAGKLSLIHIFGKEDQRHKKKGNAKAQRDQIKWGNAPQSYFHQQIR